MSQAGDLPLTTVSGTHYFGFFANGNRYAGAHNVGKLKFENYTGANVAVTLTYMNVVRVLADGSAYGVANTEPVIVYNVRVGEGSTQSYTINVSAGSGGMAGGGGTFTSGELVSLTASPNAGFLFDGWFENNQRVQGAEAAYNFNATANRTLEARFISGTPQPITYTITATAGAGGTVTGGGTFEAGTSVNLRATANSGHTFAGWFEDGTRVTGAGANYTFSAIEDRALEARFTVTQTPDRPPGGGSGPGPGALPPPVEPPPGETPPPPPSSPDYTPFAVELNRLGLFLGYGDDDAGNPVFGLGDELSRIQALVLTLRMLGLEDAVQAHTGSHPFTDVSGWQTPYVAYAFENGLTMGVSADRFDPRSQVTLQQFTTFMLRSLKYSDTDGEDFEYADAIEFALSLGLLTDDLLAEFGSAAFLRGEAVRVMINALLTKVNEEDGGMLLHKLAGAEVFTQEAAEAFLAAVS